jgi:hypothetical protein
MIKGTKVSEEPVASVFRIEDRDLDAAMRVSILISFQLF